MLNERTRVWADTSKGKEIQCTVFGKLAELVNQRNEGKNEFFSINFLEAKTVDLIDPSGCSFESVKGNGERVPMKAHDCFIYALYRLEEHGLVKVVERGKGYDVRIMKKGWQRWESRL